MKLNKILFIVGVSLVVLGIGFLIAGGILSFAGKSKIADIFLGFSSILGVLSLVVLIIRLIFMARNSVFTYTEERQQPKVVKVVDVKDITKSKEQKLYEQYEDLYKQNLISKEDLDRKRKELLGK